MVTTFNLNKQHSHTLCERLISVLHKGVSCRVASQKMFLLLLFLDAPIEGKLRLMNAAYKKPIHATATCGEDLPYNTSGGKKYCTLSGECSKCLSEDEQGRDRSIENALIMSNTWWQSPPLSRGMEYSKVNITVDFKQIFWILYIRLQFGNSPSPGVWSIEKSTDGGLTYSTWYNYATSIKECEKFFGKENTAQCKTTYSSMVPLKNGKMSALLYGGQNRTSDWYEASSIRLRFLNVSTFGDLKDASNKYFYSLKHISVAGYCVCNGIVGACEYSNTNLYQCRCKHNTTGLNCQLCKDGYRKSISNDKQLKCEPCQCDAKGSVNRCEAQCICKEGYAGELCNRCDVGYLNFPYCKKERK